jgi:hypothetical protein
MPISTYCEKKIWDLIQRLFHFFEHYKEISLGFLVFWIFNTVCIYCHKNAKIKFKKAFFYIFSPSYKEIAFLCSKKWQSR